LLTSKGRFGQTEGTVLIMTDVAAAFPSTTKRGDG
jgi:hypothetical protein